MKEPILLLALLFLTIILSIPAGYSAEYPSLDKSYSWSYDAWFSDIGNSTVTISLDYSNEYNQWIIVIDKYYAVNNSLAYEYAMFMYDNWTVDYIIMYDPGSNREIHVIYDKPKPLSIGYHPSTIDESYTGTFNAEYYDPDTDSVIATYTINVEVECRGGFSVLYNGRVIPVFQVNYTETYRDYQGYTATIKYSYLINKDFRFPFIITRTIDGEVNAQYILSNYTITPDPIKNYPLQNANTTTTTTTTTQSPSTTTSTSPSTKTTPGINIGVGGSTGNNSGTSQTTTTKQGGVQGGSVIGGSGGATSNPGSSGSTGEIPTVSGGEWYTSPVIIGSIIAGIGGVAVAAILYSRKNKPSLPQPMIQGGVRQGPVQPPAPVQAAPRYPAPKQPVQQPLQAGSLPPGKKICPVCGSIIPAKAKYCPVCGAKQPV